MIQKKKKNLGTGALRNGYPTTLLSSLPSNIETIHFLPLPGVGLEPPIDSRSRKVKNLPLRNADLRL